MRYFWLCETLRLPAVKGFMKKTDFLLISLCVMCTMFVRYSPVQCFDIDDVPSEDLYFEVVYPKDIGFVYKTKMAKDFGRNIEHVYHNVNLVPVIPSHGCGTPYNGDELQLSFALVARGECSFLSKAVQAERSGALGLVIMDSDVDNDHSYIEMIDDKTNRSVTIPALFLLGKNGHMIVKSLKEHQLRHAVINIPLNLTGIPIKQPPWMIW